MTSGLVAVMCFVAVGLLWERYASQPSLADQLAQSLYGAPDALALITNPKFMTAVANAQRAETEGPPDSTVNAPIG